MTKAVVPKNTKAAVQAQLGWPVVQLKASHDLALNADDVTQEGALAVVPVFTGMHAGDSLTLHWQGYWSATPEPEWTKTIVLDGTDIQRPILIYIDAYQVWEIPGNYAEVSFELTTANRAQAGVSPLQTLQISPPVSPRLVAPAVEGHDSSQPIYPTAVVLQIDAYPGMQLDDDVVLYADGAPDEGTVVMSQRIDSSHMQAGIIEFAIGPAWLLANQGARVSVIYQYARPGAAKTSEALVLNVLETLDLPPPNVERADIVGDAGEYKGDLLATAAASAVYVNVPESVALEAGDKLEVHWDGHPAGGQHIAASPVSSQDPRRFLIPATAVAANMGGEDKRFNVFYRFTPFNAESHDSRPFFLRIVPLPQSQYPMTRLARGGNTVSLKQVPLSGEELRLEKWTFMAAGQLLSMEVTGVNKAGGPARTVIRDAVQVSPEEVSVQRISSKVSHVFLTNLKLNTSLTLKAHVSFDGGATTNYFLSNTGITLVE